MPTLALKSPRRMCLSVRGVAENTESRSSKNLSLTSSGLVIVGAEALTIVACLLPDKGNLNVIKRSFMPFESAKSLLTRCDLKANPIPARHSCVHFRRKCNQHQLLLKDLPLPGESCSAIFSQKKTQL